MKFEDIQPIVQTLSTISDLTTVVLNVKQLKAKISGKTFVDTQKDLSIIEDILSECFIRKEVLWQRVDYENFRWCINSIIDLQSKCDEYKAKFTTIDSNTKHFYSQLMRLWGDECNETYKELYRNQSNNQFELLIPLKKMRLKCYKIIITFAQLLPEGNLTKTRSFDKLELGCKYTKLSIRQVLPEWSIE